MFCTTLLSEALNDGITPSRHAQRMADWPIYLVEWGGPISLKQLCCRRGNGEFEKLENGFNPKSLAQLVRNKHIQTNWGGDDSPRAYACYTNRALEPDGNMVERRAE